MSAIDITREDFARVENRVTTVEQEVEGEKQVSRYILNQARQNGDDLAVLKTRMDRVESELLDLKQEFSSLRSEMTSLKTEVSSLRRELPEVISSALRDVLRQPGK